MERFVHTGGGAWEGSWQRRGLRLSQLSIDYSDTTVCTLPYTNHNRLPTRLPGGGGLWLLSGTLETGVDAQGRCSRKRRVGPRRGSRKHRHLWGGKRDPFWQGVQLGVRGSSQGRAGQGQPAEGRGGRLFRPQESLTRVLSGVYQLGCGRPRKLHPPSRMPPALSPRWDALFWHHEQLPGQRAHPDPHAGTPARPQDRQFSSLVAA